MIRVLSIRFRLAVLRAITVPLGALFWRLEQSRVRLQTRPDNLGAARPEDFADTLRRHKAELMDWLEAKSANLTPDCAPWLHIARQVLAGEFAGADRSTVESLIIGLRGVRHPLCQQALARLHRD